MRASPFLYILLILSTFSCAQKSIPEVLEKFNENTVPYISVEDLNTMPEVVILDTRKLEEYKVSHIKNAIWVGYETFDIASITKTFSEKDTIVVYCSVGIRSEDIGEKLNQAGLSNVKNLYGGIFAWKNQGYPVYDAPNKKTEKVHAYSKYWANLLTNADKVYTLENLDD
ncbi:MULTISPECIES: rhodanese-like domain-containing protein [Flavobacteriaceae]|uniref:rhodanese-like domain-containing protein n=1 Tax=Flavobacteriaceae TaxID=49546 RepID=UPI00149114AD|nr:MULTISPECIES: rhodanese-like domain-containing protein [Allomuricauda]MDC6365552.1 rhodanese-like domain-containing protein [Muricauda sp. AC10]